MTDGPDNIELFLKALWWVGPTTAEVRGCAWLDLTVIDDPTYEGARILTITPRESGHGAD